MAGADAFHVDIKGRGAHGAYPHQSADPVMTAVSIAQAFQSIVSRNLDPTEMVVISVTQIHTGIVDNIIPEHAYMNGTVRCFSKEVQSIVKQRMQEIVAGQAVSFGVEAVLRYDKGYPPTINDAEKSAFAISVAEEVAGKGNVEANQGVEMGAEDFSYMLNERPGAYLFLGIGEAAGLHNPNYDFNDSAAPFGASFFARLVETAQPISKN